MAELWGAVREVDHLLCLRNTFSWPEGVWELSGAGHYLGFGGFAGLFRLDTAKYRNPLIASSTGNHSRRWLPINTPVSSSGMPMCTWHPQMVSPSISDPYSAAIVR